MKGCKETGAGIVEVMIGLFIGTLVILIAYGTLIVFRSLERTGMGSSSAIENGLTALRSIENAGKNAGLGFVTNNLISCTTFNASYNGTLVANGASIAPVSITSGGNQPDSVTMIFGNSIGSGAPAVLVNSVTTNSGSGTVNNAYGMSANDYALLSNAGTATPCTLIQLNSVTNNGVNSALTFTAGGVPATTYPTSAQLTDIGDLNWVTWKVNSNVLQRLSNTTSPAAAISIADNIVQLKAQYGVTNGTSQAISQWVDPTGTWATLTSALIARIRAIRVAIVVRNIAKEKYSVAQSACTTTTTAPTVWPDVPGTTFDLTASTDWKCYRYQVYRLVIPLKNVLLGGVQ